MELQYDDETARPTHEQLDNYSNLCKRGLYLDALDTAERDFGPLHNWQHSELRIIAVKALSNLGLRRSADAIIFRSWRRNRREPKILPYYLQATLARRGPLNPMPTPDQYATPPPGGQSSLSAVRPVA